MYLQKPCFNTKNCFLGQNLEKKAVIHSHNHSFLMSFFSKSHITVKITVYLVFIFIMRKALLCSAALDKLKFLREFFRPCNARLNAAEDATYGTVLRTPSQLGSLLCLGLHQFDGLLQDDFLGLENRMYFIFK